MRGARVIRHSIPIFFWDRQQILKKAVVKVDSSYPWEGKVTYQVKAKMKDAFELAIHIPSHIRMDTLCVTVNGEKDRCSILHKRTDIFI